MKKNKFFKMVLLCLSIVLCMGVFVGCGDEDESSSTSSTSNLSSGERITLSEEAVVCSSKENVDKLIDYIREENSAGKQEMYERGDAITLPQGTEVNIVKVGIVTEVETGNGETWFAPIEVFQDK
ncbi:hypothetical protein FDF18_06465 [Clostridium sporogenes]|uniref:hypothetical protein n=1 Tax=Clostridium sporogenes TaxID=1509 RepID=UPI0013CBE4A4|nr:hypothetical protein [Clostridium sporogenes]NFT02951.1 hypothetical protein [Clostridium sporogenes]NFT32888.1 hypothetical protein [Clostridium sporogenes]NFT38421.1 hypothetical protein [Clostridium sporogenes]NFT52630.1 hypothetical protein [Clostridium sporogenes]NFT75672.1 hypothetical protein [Clostridium sporogenes]